MQINSLPKSNITEAAPSATTAVAEPPKPAAKPAVLPKPEAKKPDPEKPGTAPEGADKSKPEITDVKPTGETTTQGEPTFTLKVNGKEIVATQSQIIAMAQRAQGADAAMKKYAELEKLSTNLLENLDSNTYELLKQRHGKEKAKEMIIAMTRNLIAEEEKTPEQVELEELRAKAKNQEEVLKKAEEQKKLEERRAKQKVLYTQMLQEIDRELNDTHLPKDRLTLTRVLNYLAAGKKANGTAWTVKDAVKAVEVEDMAHASYYAKRYVEGKLPSEKFREIFGEEALKKLNKDQIEVLKKADKIVKNEQPKAESNGAAPAPDGSRRRSLSKNKGTEAMSEREYRKQFGSLGGI